MSDRWDPVPELAAATADRAAAWRFIRRFCAAWLAPFGPDDGCAEEALRAAEAALGLALPAALREGYALLGGRPDLTSNQDTLLPPDELYVDDGALVFRVENQACAFWGVPLAELGRADPPTAMRPDLADKSAERWEPWLPTVSMSLVEVVLSESLAGEDGLSDHRDGEDADDALLAAHFARLPVPAYPIGQPEQGSRWWYGHDLLVRDDGGWLSARARTPQAWEALRELLPGDWMEE